MDDTDKYLSAETKKIQVLSDENTTAAYKNIIKPIGINDILEVCNEDDRLVTCNQKLIKIILKELILIFV